MFICFPIIIMKMQMDIQLIADFPTIFIFRYGFSLVTVIDELNSTNSPCFYIIVFINQKIVVTCELNEKYKYTPNLNPI